MLFTFAVLSGCSKDGFEDTSQYGASEPNSLRWNLLADGLGEGSLLSAWSDSGVTHIVGGDMANGPGLRVAYDGENLCIEPEITERALWWIHGDRPGRWVAVGESGIVLLSEDGARTRIDIPSTANLYGVWVTADSITVVGGYVETQTGEVWRHKNGEWSALSTTLPGVAFKVWENWVVGANLTYTVDAQGELTSHGDAGRLLTVRGDGERVFAVGGLSSSLVVQHDGFEWSELNTAGLGQPLNGVFTGSDSDLWVAGNFGTVARLEDNEWVTPEWPITEHHFHAVWPHRPDEVLFLGGNFMNSGDNFGTIGRYGPEREPPEVTMCSP